MNSKLQEKLNQLPTKSGVYIMHSKDGDVIYVGKAKNLKNRVSSYFNKTNKTAKVQAMVEKIDWFEYIITPTELDAFTLENNLIKKHQPFYNILLKDSKTFPYIKINLNSIYPRFYITRKVEKDGCKYFGPFLAGISATKIVDFINSYFKLRTCKSTLEKASKRECINFQMGLCSAPCTRKIEANKYLAEVNKAIDFLKGNDSEVINNLQEKMKNLAYTENFEKAIEYRQWLDMIKKIGNQSIANLPKRVSKDAIYYATNDITSSISILSVRNGRILGVESFSIVDASLSGEEIVENFISSYYQNSIKPDEIICNFKPLDEDNLCKFLDKKIKFISSPKSINLRLLNMAKENAFEHLEKNMSRDKQKYDNTLGAIKLLQEKLNLKNYPRRIECYDISNISGTNKVSSMVVFKNGEASKSDYRKFKIKTVKGIDDFASLKEALERRLIRLKNLDGNSFKEKPDLLIIDGGKGQLSSCYEILKKYNFEDIDIIGLAKRLEEVFKVGSQAPILLDHSTAPLKLLQRIRDEAHRFAITFHRQQRSKNMLASQLDNIKGLGPKKKALLLNSFDNIDNIKKASVEDLNSVKGIDLNLATNIYKTLKNS